MTVQALIFAVLAATPFLGFLAFPGGREEFLVAYEVVVAAGTAGLLIVLSRKTRVAIQRTKLSLLALAMAACAAGEAVCGINFLRDNIGARGQTHAELFYVVFWSLLVCVMRWHYGPLMARWNFLGGLMTALAFAIVTWTQVKFIFPEMGILGLQTISALYITCWLAMKSVAVVFAMAYSTRAQKIDDFIFLQSVVALFCAGLSSAYQAVTIGHGALYWFEASWAAGLCGILCAVVIAAGGSQLLFFERPKLAEWYSIRAALSVWVFVAICAVLVGASLADMVSVDRGVNFALLLLLIFASWLSSNCIALRIAGHMQHAIAAVPETIYAQLETISGFAADERRNRLLAEYRELFIRHEELTLKTVQLSQSTMENKREAAIGRLASQVAHDIRSPLTALEITMKDSHALPEETRLLTRAAIQRVQDIANSLLARSRSATANASVSGKHLLVGIVNTVLSEKRTKIKKYLGLSIAPAFEEGTYLEHVECDATELASALSNLIDNSIEAMSGQGNITVKLQRNNDGLRLDVVDDGPGISPEILCLLGKKGATFGKSQGNGLGLYGTRCLMEKLGGSFKIASECGFGTAVQLIFRTCGPPEWFAKSIDLREVTDIVVVDDDITIHKVWAERFKTSLGKRVRVYHLSSPSDLITWVENRQSTGHERFLVDFEFADDCVTGVDLIEKLSIGPNAFLVSSRVEEPAVLQRLRALNLRALPKQAAPYVPIITMVSGTAVPLAKLSHPLI